MSRATVSVLVIVSGLVVLYAFDYLEGRWDIKPAVSRLQKPIAATNSAAGKYAISNALVRVYADINAATNTNDVAAYRLMEQVLTNALSK